MTERLVAFAVLLLVLTMPGCKRQPDIVVKVTDQDLQRLPVSVDIVGVNDADRNKWATKRLSEYWSDNDPDGLRDGALQAGLLKPMKFGPGFGTEHTLPGMDPIWGQWKRRKATSIFLMADIPGVANDSDKRRELTRKGVSGKTVTFDVRKGGLSEPTFSK
jgi:hypothetical protein